MNFKLVLLSPLSADPLIDLTLLPVHRMPATLTPGIKNERSLSTSATLVPPTHAYAPAIATMPLSGATGSPFGVGSRLSRSKSAAAGVVLDGEQRSPNGGKKHKKKKTKSPPDDEPPGDRTSSTSLFGRLFGSRRSLKKVYKSGSSIPSTSPLSVDTSSPASSHGVSSPSYLSEQSGGGLTPPSPFYSPHQRGPQVLPRFDVSGACADPAANPMLAPKRMDASGGYSRDKSGHYIAVEPADNSVFHSLVEQARLTTSGPRSIMTPGFVAQEEIRPTGPLSWNPERTDEEEMIVPATKVMLNDGQQGIVKQPRTRAARDYEQAFREYDEQITKESTSDELESSLDSLDTVEVTQGGKKKEKSDVAKELEERWKRMSQSNLAHHEEGPKEEERVRMEELAEEKRIKEELLEQQRRKEREEAEEQLRKLEQRAEERRRKEAEEERLAEEQSKREEEEERQAQEEERRARLEFEREKRARQDEEDERMRQKLREEEERLRKLEEQEERARREAKKKEEELAQQKRLPPVPVPRPRQTIAKKEGSPEGPNLRTLHPVVSGFMSQLQVSSVDEDIPPPLPDDEPPSLTPSPPSSPSVSPRSSVRDQPTVQENRETVVLRRSSAQKTTESPPPPSAADAQSELLKVFHRRSLKLKDGDEIVVEEMSPTKEKSPPPVKPPQVSDKRRPSLERIGPAEKPCYLDPDRKSPPVLKSSAIPIPKVAPAVVKPPPTTGLSRPSKLPVARQDSSGDNNNNASRVSAVRNAFIPTSRSASHSAVPQSVIPPSSAHIRPKNGTTTDKVSRRGSMPVKPATSEESFVESRAKLRSTGAALLENLTGHHHQTDGTSTEGVSQSPPRDDVNGASVPVVPYSRAKSVPTGDEENDGEIVIPAWKRIAQQRKSERARKVLMEGSPNEEVCL